MAPDQAAAENELRTSYADWKRLYVTSSGAGGNLRVVSRTGCAGSGVDDTVSEAQGYGAVISMYMNDRDTFDKLFRYTRSKLDSNGLMQWCISANGNTPDGLEGTSATDGDTDIVWGLIFADKLWGSNGSINYAAEARAMIGAIWEKTIPKDTYLLTGGDSQIHQKNTNPSYWDPAIYRVFASFTGNNDWNKVIDRLYDIAGKIQKYDNGTGLVPEDSSIDGTKVGDYSYDFGYNAVRYPWRIVKDYLWFGTAQAKTNVDRLNGFWRSQGVGNIVDGYTITGAKRGDWRGAAVTSMAAAGFMTGTYSDDARTFYNAMVSTVDGDSWGYYGNSLRLLGLLMTTGNMPNLYAGSGGDTGGASTAATQIRGKASSKCLDVDDGKTADGTTVQMWTCDSATGNQKWSLSPDGSLKALGKCLDVSKGGTVNGTRVYLWSCGEGTTQDWEFTSGGQIRNVASGRCLDVVDSGTADGTAVQIWDCHSGGNQSWDRI